MLALGLRLDDVGTDRLSWRDLYVVVHQSGPRSALARALDPEAAAWASGEATAYLLAGVVDLLAMGNWQRQGKKNSPKPKPVPRPGSKATGTTYGADPIPVSDFEDWWSNPEGR